jgi:hypothetical protein
VDPRDATLGGYLAEHRRPPAFEGADGAAYTADVVVEETDGAPEGPWGAILFFLRWREGRPVGHLETGFVAYGATESEALAAARRMHLREVKRWLDRAIQAERATGR